MQELVVLVEAAKLPLSVPTATVVPAAGADVTLDVGTIKVPAPLESMATLPTEVPPIVTSTLVPAALVSPVSLTSLSAAPTKLPVC